MRADTGRGSRHPAPPCALPAPSSRSPCARGCRAPEALGQSHTHLPPMALLAMAGLGQHSSTASPRAALGARCSPRSNVPAAWGPPCPSMPSIPVGWGLAISLCQASTVLLQRISVQPKKPTTAAIPLSKPPATICHGCQERTAPGFTQTRPQVVLAPKATARGRGGAGGAECHGPWGRRGCRSPPAALGPAGAAAPCPQERPRAAQGCALPLHLATRPCALL